MDHGSLHLSLVELPHGCLSAIVRCLADDQCALSSCARAHSSLRKLAVATTTSIAAYVSQQQQDSLQLYLRNHAQHISSLELVNYPSCRTFLAELPAALSLDSLKLKYLKLQLQAGEGFEGVLRPGFRVKQLCINYCMLLDGEKALEAALPELPLLEHLSVELIESRIGSNLAFPGGALQQLPQLTYLELGRCPLQGSSALQYIRNLPALQDLRLDLSQYDNFTVHSVDTVQQLTTLRVSCARFDPAVLAGRTQLQDLALCYCKLLGGPSGVAALLSELRQLTQLTLLCLDGALSDALPVGAAAAAAAAAAATIAAGDAAADAAASAAAAAEAAVAAVQATTAAAAAPYRALTASSSLQVLQLSECKVSKAAWQQVFRTDKQLPHLRMLDASYTNPESSRMLSSSATYLDASDIARLAGCAPALQSVTLNGIKMTGDTLAPLCSLTGINRLVLTQVDDAGAGLLTQLTKLTYLELWGPCDVSDAGLLQLAALKGLTHFVLYSRRLSGRNDALMFDNDPEDGPVWQRLLFHCLSSRDAAVAESAAAKEAAEGLDLRAAQHAAAYARRAARRKASRHQHFYDWALLQGKLL